MCCLTEYVKAALRHKIAIYMYNTTTAFKKNKDVIFAAPCYHTKLSNSRRAERLFRGNSDAEDELQRHSVILSFSFLRDFGLQSSPTHTSWLLSGGIASAIFFLMKSEEIHKQPKADHTSFSLPPPPPPLLLLHYSIILSDRPSLWALAPLLIPISERQRGPLVCQHASSNWIIPEIWESAQKGICN